MLEKFLLDGKKADKEKVAELRKQAKDRRRALQEFGVSGNLLSEKELTKLYADEIEVPFVELNPAEIKHDNLQLLSERIARQYGAVVFDTDKDGVKQVAMEDPDDIQALNFLHKELGSDLKVFITPSSQLQAALDQYRDNISNELTKVISDDDLEVDENAEIDEKDVAEDSPIAQTVNIIIEYGIKSGASDIHIEPRENDVVVRYRIDGMLREANKLPRKLLGALVSRIKILSNLKIDEHRAPQDGRFKVRSTARYTPCASRPYRSLTEKKWLCAMLNESSKPADLLRARILGNRAEELQHAIVQPHGMVLVTGPTGSGKSTTLFSVLSSLNTPDVNISTVEDPIEYHIVGANQTQVNPVAGMTFGSGLARTFAPGP